MTTSAAPPRKVLIVSTRTESALAQAVAAQCRRLPGAPVVTEAVPGGSTARLADGRWQFSCTDPGPFDQWIRESGPPDCVYFLEAATGAGGPAEASFAQAAAGNELVFLRLIKALEQDGRGGRTDCYVISQDTQSVAGEPVAPHGGGLIGLAYFLASHGRRFAVRNLDVAAAELATGAGTAALAAAVMAEPPTSRGDLIALRGGHRYRQETQPTSTAPLRDAPPGLRRGGGYVIVGGSGVVGKIITSYLTTHFDARVAWVGRRPAADPGVRNSLAGIAIRQPCYVQGDVTGPRQACRAIASAKAQLGSVHGVIFASATRITTAPAGLSGVGEDEFRAHFDVKAAGCRNVYAAVEHEPLDFLCYFSSAQAFSFGGADTHAAYAAGITSADAFARAAARTAPFPVGVINWGAWRASFEDAAGSYPGVGFLTDGEGSACFDAAITMLRGTGCGQVVCMRRHPAQRQAPAQQPPALPGNSGPHAGTGPALRREGTTASGGDAGPGHDRTQIRRFLAERLSHALRVPADALSASAAFADLGVDSITGSLFVTEVSEAFGVPLNNAILYDFASIERLADHLAGLISAPGPGDGSPAVQPDEPAIQAAGQRPVPNGLIELLEERFAAGELPAEEVLRLLDAELAGGTQQ